MAAVALSAAFLVLAMPGTGHAQPGGDQVTLCHQTADGSYETITVSASGAQNGHSNHAGDIIPAPAAGCPTGGPVPAVPGAAPKDGRVTVCHLTAKDGYVKITIAQAGWDNGHSKHAGDILLTGSSASASCTDALITLGAAAAGKPGVAGIDVASLVPSVPTAAADPALPTTGTEHTTMSIVAALALMSGLWFVRIGNKRFTS